MKELAIRFGHEGQLAGIVSEPGDRGSGLALILVSAGLMPKSGPYRLYAEIARSAARSGVLALRFDLGGIGDSGRPNGNLELARRVQLEIRAAVDHVVETYGARPIGLCGLCSGAEDSFRYAASDPRIAAVSMIDSFAYRSRGWFWRNALFRARRRLMRALGRYEPMDYGPTGLEGAATPQSLIDYRYMQKDEAEPLLKGLVARKVLLHFIYTGGAADKINHKSQFSRMFPGVDLGSRTVVELFPFSEHTPILGQDRREIVEAIVGRLTRVVASG